MVVAILELNEISSALLLAKKHSKVEPALAPLLHTTLASNNSLTLPPRPLPPALQSTDFIPGSKSCTPPPARVQIKAPQPFRSHKHKTRKDCHRPVTIMASFKLRIPSAQSSHEDNSIIIVSACLYILYSEWFLSTEHAQCDN